MEGRGGAWRATSLSDLNRAASATTNTRHAYVHAILCFLLQVYRMGTKMSSLDKVGCREPKPTTVL